MNSYELKVIATIHTEFPAKFGLPRQSNLIPELCGTIIFEPDFRDKDAVRGLEDFSHLWLIWGFSGGFSSCHNSEQWSPTVRPPRLGGNTRVGVFATRSPNRPNPIGLSVVKLLEIRPQTANGPQLYVSGIDMMDGTPIFDIKPYLPHIESISGAKGGFAVRESGSKLNVIIPKNLEDIFPSDFISKVSSLLSEDPRPSYQHDPSRIYGFVYDHHEIKFSVDRDTAIVCSISPV